ncbi:MCE family protein [Nocardioides marmorisolisilvae]|uniref:MCE family protein n=1 Tax=Nocardioides marmorisolisilvae TaxID=1542737 RepID=A0A3N0DRZ0_9ACTN|nr:MCE family protein [Nocardioides marmorisolisilvae]RNL78397.1 MCE family protein [Nocardioides marmorisolisilvae]
MKRLLTGALMSALLLTGGCGFAGMSDLPLPGGPDVGSHPITVTADFSDVLSLARDATVKYDGVTVGKVAKVGRHGWQARVTLELRGDLDLPANTTARIAQTSLLGEKYVELAKPAHATGHLGNGDRIALASTSRGREVEEVLGALSLLLNGGGVAQLQTITHELGTAFGDQGSTKAFLRELDQFVTTLDRNRSTIIATLENVNRLSGQIARDRTTIAAAVATITPAVHSLAQQRTQLVTMLNRLSEFGTVTSSLLRRSTDDLVADLKALEPVLQQLQKAGDAVPRVLETVLSFPFPDEVLKAVKGDYVNLDVLVDLSPLTLLGNATGDDEKLQNLPGALTPPRSGTTTTTSPVQGAVGAVLDLIASLTGTGR